VVAAGFVTAAALGAVVAAAAGAVVAAAAAGAAVVGLAAAAGAVVGAAGVAACEQAASDSARALRTASGAGAHRILELGTGTGETARRLLDRHPSAQLVGIDSSQEMLAAAELPPERVALRVGRLEVEIPSGPFDLVASALVVHHLGGEAKTDLFARVRHVLAPGGRFVLADVVAPPNPADQVTSLTPGFDRPSSLEEQLEWLAAEGFEVSVH